MFRSYRKRWSLCLKRHGEFGLNMPAYARYASSRKTDIAFKKREVNDAEERAVQS
jgi:hypothetical protein